jgi:hypothetical protein
MSEGWGVRSVLEPGAEGGTIECETVLGAMVAAVLQAGGTDADAISAARNDVLTEMGEAALVDVCAVIGMFDGINKLADMTGCEWDSDEDEVSDGMMVQLGLTAPRAKAQKFVSANATAARTSNRL